jgi:hypothetical protein
MKTKLKFTVIAALVLAMVFSLNSCGNADDDNGGNGGGGLNHTISITNDYTENVVKIKVENRDFNSGSVLGTVLDAAETIAKDGGTKDIRVALPTNIIDQVSFKITFTFADTKNTEGYFTRDRGTTQVRIVDDRGDPEVE